MINLMFPSYVSYNTLYHSNPYIHSTTVLCDYIYGREYFTRALINVTYYTDNEFTFHYSTLKSGKLTIV